MVRNKYNKEEANLLVQRFVRKKYQKKESAAVADVGNEVLQP